nr:hypothetical protein [Bacteroidota bacterium]
MQKIKIILPILVTLVLTIIITANISPMEKDYEKLWSKVDSLDKLSQPRSALLVIDEIYELAKSDRNTPQIIKANLYRIKLIAGFEEDYIEKAITQIQTEIKSAGSPEKQVLNSILGELYLRYYQNNRYKILDRSQVENVVLKDIKTWDVSTIFEHASQCYQKSLEDPKELQKTKLAAFSAILIEEDDSKSYRPTLFDFLAHRAIEFYQNEETGVTKPAKQFTLNQPFYFDEARKFINLKLSAPEYPSKKFEILKIYQELIDFHYSDKQPQAFIDADLNRLEFVYNTSILAEKDSLYLKSLIDLETKTSGSPFSTNVTYRIAKFYFGQGANFKPLVSEDMRWDLKTAKEYCEKAIENYPKSHGAENCSILLESILEPEISLACDGEIVPDKATTGLLGWKNISRVYFRIVAMDHKEFTGMKWRASQEEIALKITRIPPIKDWSLALPDSGDFQMHSSEFKITGLPDGFYVLLVSNTESFEGSGLEMAWADFWVTNISYLARQNDEKNLEFYVLNRQTGSPLKDVEVDAYLKRYDYQQREYITEFWKQFTSDQNGYFEIRKDGESAQSLYLEFRMKDEIFKTESRFYLSGKSQREPKQEEKSFFFTDRSIYRPGQTVYFKAVVLEKTGDRYDILKNVTTTVEFFDVNHQKISELELKTNDYGSVNGSFIIPKGVLNGSMTINNKSGRTGIRVEEYKRPTFEVVFDPVEGSYKLNENITVDGEAKGYAGNSIDGATVSYRVVRNSFFPYRYYFYMPYFPNATETEITEGETTTDANGRFSIDFKAIPDLSIGEKFRPAFNYTVFAKVTDISGETREETVGVMVGTEALFLDVAIPEKVNQSATNDFDIKATNLNGTKQDVVIGVTVEKLRDPNRLTVERQWQRPDVNLWSKEGYIKQFPHAQYGDEENPAKWEKLEMVFTDTINTATDSILHFTKMNEWGQGSYSIILKATDEFGIEVKTEKFFTIFNPEARKTPVVTYNWFVPLKSSGEPGEEASFLVGTSDRGIKAIYEIEHRNKTVHREWLRLDREQVVIKVPIREDYRGNFTVKITFVKDDRVFENRMLVKVPYTNKKLDITFETFRSDLEPGSKETWKLKITGKDGENVAAEMLASMYDASLDAFAGHNWNFDLYPFYSSVWPWKYGDNFSITRGSIYDASPIRYRNPFIQGYDQLNWFGWGHYSRYRDALEGGVRMSSMDAKAAGMQNEAMEVPLAGDVADEQMGKSEEIPNTYQELGQTGQEGRQPGVQLRRDFRETAFFYPDLHTNEDGDVIINFTLPESFTRWKFMGLAYTEDLKTGFLEKELTASKKLMVIPNAPRFFRQGDTLWFTAKVVNLSDQDLSGSAVLEFFNTIDMRKVSGDLGLSGQVMEFSVEKGRSTTVSWEISVPEDFSVLTYQVKATAGNFTDGEEKTLPVLPNRMMVTESMPLPVNGNETKNFSFEKLINSKNSSSIKNYKLTLEFSSNPAWYAVQALPVMSEPKYKNASSVFGSFFANSIAFYLANSDPKIKRVFEQWKEQSPESFLSNLEKNQELKSLLLEQTPWVLEADNESERKQRIALLFDINNMQNRLDGNIRMLEKMQSSNGGFPWFEGMRESRFITQSIVEGLGKLHHLGIIDAIGDKRVDMIVKKAVRYLDDRIREDLENIKKHFPEKLEENHLSSTQIQFLYARSFFRNIMMNPNSETAFNYFVYQAEKYWTKQNQYMQGMIALALNRYDKSEAPRLIIKSLKEHALESEEMGMYWRLDRGWFWYMAPVETQAMMIEAFDEVAGDKKSVEEMKIWLLKQKQTQDWGTDRATIEAVYALLARGPNLLAGDELAEIEIGGEKLDRSQLGKIEAGTGYFQKSWNGTEIEPDMGRVTIEKRDQGIAWGALYWQYFEDLDKITVHETPLSLQKQLFIEKNTP